MLYSELHTKLAITANNHNSKAVNAISRSREHNSLVGALHINFIAINIYEQFDN